MSFIQVGLQTFIGAVVVGTRSGAAVAGKAMPVDDALDIGGVGKRYAGYVTLRSVGVAVFCTSGPQGNNKDGNNRDRDTFDGKVHVRFFVRGKYLMHIISDRGRLLLLTKMAKRE